MRIYTKDPVVTARRLEVAKLMKQGLMGYDITRELNMGKSVVYADMRIIEAEEEVQDDKPVTPKVKVFPGLNI